jgi:hypothetical protein
MPDVATFFSYCLSLGLLALMVGVAAAAIIAARNHTRW